MQHMVYFNAFFACVSFLFCVNISLNLILNTFNSIVFSYKLKMYPD